MDQILNNYLLTYDSYVPLYNRFHRGEWITRVSGGAGALDTPGPLNGTSEASAIWAQHELSQEALHLVLRHRGPRHPREPRMGREVCSGDRTGVDTRQQTG
jgi:hypothetical protein